MTNAFNQIATDYDSGFTYTDVGELQRNIVRDYLENKFKDSHKLSILELNCGTGEDAIWFASKGYKVFATDVSANMLDVAKSKAIDAGVEMIITFSILDISKTESYPQNMKFDLIFSNFGGINCISPFALQKAMGPLAGLLNPGGHLIAVIMPKFCIWESFYFSTKAKFSEVFRRNRSASLNITIGKEVVETWYFSPTDLKEICSHEFNKPTIRPVGFLIPPSYLNDFFRKHTKTLRALNRLDKYFRRFSSLAGISDHFIIDLEVKS